MRQRTPPHRGHFSILIVGSIAAALVLILVACGSPNATSPDGGAVPPAEPAAAEPRNCGQQSDELSVGDQLPSGCRVELFDDGRIVTLAEFQADRPIVLNFWATWCPFCIDEMPDFQRVYADLGGRVEFLGLDLLGVQGETRGAALSLAKQTGVRYPLAFDEGGELYIRFSPRILMPTTALVASDGTIAYRQFGPLTAERLQELIREHLGV